MAVKTYRILITETTEGAGTTVLAQDQIPVDARMQTKASGRRAITQLLQSGRRQALDGERVEPDVDGLVAAQAAYAEAVRAHTELED